MVSSEPSLAVEDDYFANNMKEMIGGCCVCSDERGWAENPLVYCDGHGCNVAVHQACYGIVQVPTGPWFCRKCESQERAARVRCELCPHKDGALKRTDNGGWAHVVCALYIPEVEFANVSTMEPIVLQSVPHERYNKTCYICEEQGRESKAASGACMTCNKHGCRQAFHVTCAQFAGLLCEEQGSDADNVKYCGYCKYHYSKLKHKDRDRHKPKHRKVSDPSSALVPPLMVTSEKTYSSSSSSSSSNVTSVPSSQKRLDDSAGRFTNANFQEVPTHPGPGAKDGGPAEAKGLEGKSKRASSHGSGQRGRKSTPGKPPLSTVVSTTPPTMVSSSTTSPFQQGLLLGSSGKPSSGGSVNQPTQEFQSFSEPSLRSDPLFGRGLPKVGGEGGSTEGLVTLSTFGSLMSLAPSSASPGTKHFENSHLAGELGSLASAAYKRPQASSTGAGVEEAAKGKKRRYNWRNRYGPCRPRELPELQGHPAPVPSSSPSSCMSLMPGRTNPANGSSSGGGMQKSPSLLRNGSLQSLSVSSSPLGPGAFPSSDPLAPLLSAVTGPSVPLSSTELPQQLSSVSSMPSTTLLTPLPHSMPAGPLSNTACTYSNALPGSSFNLAPSHMFGNRLNPNSAMAAMIAQSESASTDQDLGDNVHSFPGRAASPKANLSPRSPLSGLQIRYDPPGPPGPLLPSSGVDDACSLPPVATSIEQLLERQWNEGQQFLLQQGTQGDVLSMLKSLHQLQVENQRLEEQIKNLTMKKERLQLLSDQLSVPFPPASSIATASSPELHPSNTPTDGLSSNKSFHLGSSFLPDSSFNLTTQDTSCGHSSSSSSLSTPPSVGHSPPQPGQQQQQVNGMGMMAGAMQSVTMGATTSSLPGMANVTGFMGALQGGQLAMSGIVGALNGVIQSSPSLAQNSSPHSHPAVVPSVSLSIPSTLNNSSTTTAKTSVARLGLLSEQHRQILLHQHQLQQLFSSPQPTPGAFPLTRTTPSSLLQEQHQQTLLYQLMQQQHQQQHDLQQLQQFSSSQLPINSLLPAAQGAIAANPFLAMHADTTAAQKTARLAEKAGSAAGQEKS
ncbi:hypothetical protein AAFF_G00002290 [Aldrovandia affinis]|uniref:MLLT10 histone lysine methyltransferase DOT1L cofactor n=1 Tax=Aldrovandia affinis TaxID=143900 RepID=A0AAD7TD14_9TELE|nr:hypothetical protein AAFF_G00002290 [Aldrovandia affinis]